MHHHTPSQVSVDHGRPIRDATALDLLEHENEDIHVLMDRLEATRGSTVDQRAEHGDLAKELIRQVTIREAALVEITEGLATFPQLTAVTDQLRDEMRFRRRAIDRVEHMSRGVQGISLNIGQNFEDELRTLTDLLGPEIDWQTAEAIPAVHRHLDDKTLAEVLPTASRVAKHAPTNLSPEGPRWYERAPVISRIITVYDRLRDFPKAQNSGRV
jgi:hypothetical protein